MHVFGQWRRLERTQRKLTPWIEPQNLNERLPSSSLSCFGMWGVGIVFPYHTGVHSSFYFYRGIQLPTALSLLGKGMFGKNTKWNQLIFYTACVLFSPSQVDSPMKSWQSTRWLSWWQGCYRLRLPFFYEQDTRHPVGARPGDHSRNWR